MRPESPFARAITEIIDAWAIESGVVFKPTNKRALPAEAAAKAKGIGIWRGPFMAPADYREMLAGHPQER